MRAMSADDIGRGGRGTAIRVTRCPETSPRSYASACLADVINSVNVSSVMCRVLVFFLLMSSLSLDAGDDLSQSFGLGWSQIALLVLRKQKYQMDSFRMHQIKIDV